MGLWIGVAILLAIIAVLVRRGLQMRTLAQDGVPGEARIVGKNRRQGSPAHQAAGYLKYQFDTPQGRSLTNRVAVSEEVFSKYQVNDPIDIVYLEDKPNINSARYIVNLFRKALKLPPL